MNNSMILKNLRFSYLFAILVAIFLGLASRKWGHVLPSFLAENAGDALWAMMVYFGFRFLMTGRSLFLAIFLAFLTSFSIEFSQLYQAEWINHIRHTTLGGLVLGKGFLFVDLIRYSIGIIVGGLLDRYGIMRFRQTEKAE